MGMESKQEQKMQPEEGEGKVLDSNCLFLSKSGCLLQFPAAFPVLMSCSVPSPTGDGRVVLRL